MQQIQRTYQTTFNHSPTCSIKRNSKNYQIKCKVLCNNTKERRSSQLVARQTVKSWTDSRVKIKICSVMFLHSKEEQFTMASSRLQKTKSSHYQRQNITTNNKRSH